MALYADNSIMRILNSLCDVSLDGFDDRLRLQKIAFLTQKLGAPGSFTFSWYKRGPYSSSLTRVLFQCKQAGQLGKKQRLRRDEQEVVERLARLVGVDGTDNPRLLELYASVWYLIPDWKEPPDTEHAFSVMKSEKPSYTDDEVKRAIKDVLKFRKTAA